MNRIDPLGLLAIFIIIILVVNFILFLIGKVNYITFWIVIICAAISSWLIKRLRSQKSV